MKTFNVRAMVEGAVLAAVTVIMGIFYRVPVLELLTFFWPVPIIIVGYRHGFRVSIISAVVAALIISLLVNPFVGLILLLVYALPGAVIGMMLHRKLSSYAAIFVGGLLTGLTAVLEFAIMIHIMFNKNVFAVLMNFGAEIDNYYNSLYNIMAEASKVYKGLGIDENTIQQVLNLYKVAISNIKIILPAGLALVGIFVAFINFKVARIILSRLGYQVEDIKEFSRWRVRQNLVAPTLIFTLLVIALNYVNITWIRDINLNLMTILFGVYGVLGLSVIVFYIKRIGEKNEIPKPLLGIIAVVLFFLLYSILPFIGMFDLTADLRRLSRDTIGGVK
jgi:uncharacterized protein YybS (DUF2232 family)